MSLSPLPTRDSDKPDSPREAARSPDSSARESSDSLRERLDLAFWATNSAIWDWDIEKKRIWRSPGIQLLRGLPGEETVEPFDIEDDGGDWGAHIHPDDRGRVLGELHDHLQNDAAFDVSYRLRLPDGEYRWIRSVGRAVRDADGNPVRMVGSNSDITGQKSAELESERLREAVDNAAEGLAIYDERERFVYANKRYRELFPEVADLMTPGTGREDIHRAYFASGALPGAVGREEEFIDEIRRTGSSSVVAELQLADGSWIKRSEHKLPDGGIIVARTDITAIKRREQALTESEARFRSIFEDAAFGIVIADLNGDVIRCNPALMRMLGYQPGELDGKPYSFYAHPDDIAEYSALSERMLHGEVAAFKLETRFIRKDGTTLWANITDSLVGDDDTQARFRYAMIEDITERKEARREKEISEEKYRQLFDNAYDSIFVVDAYDLSFIDVNDNAASRLGYSKEEMRRLRLPDIYPPETDTSMRAITRQFLDRGEIKFEAVHVGKDGGQMPVEVTARRLSIGGRSIIQCFVRDITERKTADETLSETQAQLLNAQKMAHLGSWEFDYVRKSMTVSDELFSILGIAREEFDGRQSTFLNFVHPDDREELSRQVRALKDGKDLECTYRLQRPDGGERVVHVQGTVTRKIDGVPSQSRGFIQDITERKRAEDALRESGTRLSESQRIGRLGSWTWDGETGDLRWSDEHYRLFQIEPIGRKITHDEFFARVHPDDREELAGTIETARETGAFRPVEYRIVLPGGKTRYIRAWSEGPRDGDTNLVPMHGVAQDITNIKREAEAKRAVENRLIAILDNMPVSVVQKDSAGRYVYVNPALLRNSRYTRAEMIGKTARDLYPDLADDFEAKDRMVRDSRSAVQFEYTQRAAEDDRQFLMTKFPLIGPGGEIEFIVSMETDITERKRAEAALTASEERLRLITDNLPAFVAYVDAAGRYQFANKFFADWFERPVDEIVGHKIEDVVGSENYAMISERHDRALRGETVTRAGDVKSVGQQTGHFLAQYVPDRGPDDAVRGYYVLSQNITELKRTEDELRTSEARLNEAQRIGNIGSWDLDVETGTETLSAECCRILDFEMGAKGALFERFKQRIHPADLDGFLAARDRSLDRETPFDHEFRYVLANGDIRHLHSVGEVTFRESGHAKRMSGTVQDITERKLAEQALGESEAKFRSLFEDTTFGITITGLEDQMRICNPAYCKMLGYGLGELDDVPWATYTHPDDIAEDALLSDRLLRGEIDSYQIEKRYLRRNGEVLWAHLTVSIIGHALKSSRIQVATIEDITERKRAQDALKESEADLARAQEISHVGSWLWDIAGDNIEWSAEHFRIFGIDPAGPAPAYDTFLAMVHDEDRGAVDGAVDRALSSNTTYDMTYRLVRADGETRRVHSIGEAEYDAHGAPIRMRGTMQDITEYAQVEEQLRQAQKMEAIGQLTGGIAHDFNNLLAVIAGNLELIRNRVNGDDVLRDMAERSLSATERGASLTHRLLAFSRKQALMPATIDLNMRVSGMTDLLSRSLGETIDIRTEGARRLWPCYADPAQFENALLNLSINARDAMPEGGVLTISTANQSLDEGFAARETELETGDYVVLGVSDSGTGIAPDALEHVFEPFFTTKDVGKGSGLGLSMVYGFAKQSGGTATISSVPGQGTEVKLYLPRSAEALQAPRAAPASEQVPTARGEKILVVEDDTEMRSLAADLLSGLGYEVAVAGTAEAALEKMHQTASIDLLLTDVVLPGGMNGPDLAAKVHRQRPAVKRLFMTGHADDAFENRPEPREPLQILHKPFKMTELANTVRNVLDGR